MYLKKTAVLVLLRCLESRPFIPKNESDISHLSILLTKRTQTVADHKGEISFPGGMWEPNDPNLEHTALRETQEEIGCDPKDIRVILKLPEVRTLSSRVEITPFVAILEGNTDTLRINEIEVEQVIDFPLLHLLDHSFESSHWGTPAYQFNEHLIWGATGRILIHLRSLWPQLFAQLVRINKL
jgi:8-oxo-dGTP pyrophosphatase MutT (NUDIX family)